MQEMNDDDFFTLGVRASMQGGYWISGEVPARTCDLGNGVVYTMVRADPVCTRQDLHHTLRREWILAPCGQEIKEYVKIVHVFDVETTGLKPEEGDVAIEVAAVLVGVRPDGSAIIQQHGARSFVDPGCQAIPPQASGVHHIIDMDVVDAPDLNGALDLVLNPFGLGAVSVCAAHNSKFDRAFLPMLNDRPWIDTVRCAKHVWPDAPDFKNQTLRYWLGIELPRDGAHRALEDATVTARILARLLAERTPDQLLALSTTPVLLRKVNFGKHYGESWSDVPTDYLKWALGQIEINKIKRAAGVSVDPSPLDDPDVIFTIKTMRSGGSGR
jgi:exodeoxyribonuclease X